MKRFLFLVVLLAGCGTNTIDGTSQGSFQASIAKITRGMTRSEKEQFRKDCMAVSFGDGGLLGMAASPLALTKLDGMTVEEVRQRAEAVRAEQSERHAKETAKSEELGREAKIADEETLKVREAALEKIRLATEAQEKAQAEAQEQSFIARYRAEFAGLDTNQLKAAIAKASAKADTTIDDPNGQEHRMNILAVKVLNEMLTERANPASSRIMTIQ